MAHSDSVYLAVAAGWRVLAVTLTALAVWLAPVGWRHDAVHEAPSAYYLSGGWLEEDPASPLLANAPCTMRRVRLTELRGKEPTEPLVITDLQLQPGWHTRERWRKPSLVERHGEIELWVGDSLEMGREGPEVPASLRRLKLGEFVQSGMIGRYSFDRTTIFEDYPQLKHDFALPPPFEEDSEGSWGHLTLSVGPSGEGLGFHYHDAALNAVVYGKKRWFTCPNYEQMNETQFAALKVVLGGEETGFGQDVRMRDWVREVYPRREVQEAMRAAEVHECVQHAVRRKNACRSLLLEMRILHTLILRSPRAVRRGRRCTYRRAGTTRS